MKVDFLHPGGRIAVAIGEIVEGREPGAKMSVGDKAFIDGPIGDSCWGMHWLGSIACLAGGAIE